MRCTVTIPVTGATPTPDRGKDPTAPMTRFGVAVVLATLTTTGTVASGCASTTSAARGAGAGPARAPSAREQAEVAQAVAQVEFRQTTPTYVTSVRDKFTRYERQVSRHVEAGTLPPNALLALAAQRLRAEEVMRAGLADDVLDAQERQAIDRLLDEEHAAVSRWERATRAMGGGPPAASTPR
jgi:hypothetical protein